MKLKPTHDNVLVKRKSSDKKSPGGVIIPEAAQSKSAYAEVLAVGPGRMNEDGVRIPLELKPGDVVLVPKYAGSEVGDETERHLLLRESEILGVLE